MSLALSCSQCGKGYRNIPEKFYGRRIKCRGCEAVIEVPDPHATHQRKRLRSSRRAAEQEASAAAEVEKPKKKSRRQKNKKGVWSLTRIYIALVIVVCLGTWGEMAASYARGVKEWTPGASALQRVSEDPVLNESRSGGVVVMVAAVLDFITNSFTQLPNLIQVFGHAFTKAWGVLIVFVLVQSVLACLLCVMKGLELKMEQDARKQRVEHPELG